MIKELLSRIAKKCLTDKQYDIIWSKYIIWMEKYGKNRGYMDAVWSTEGEEEPDRQYYVFRWMEPNYSIFSVGLKMLLAREWAEKNHFIPVVDIEYEEDYMNGELGISNEWEFCFEQPCMTKDVARKKNVLTGPLIKGTENWKYLRETCREINGDEHDLYIHAIDDPGQYKEYYKKLNSLSRDIWTLKPEILKDVELIWKEDFEGKRVLGVSLREMFNGDEDKKSLQKVVSKHPSSLKVEEICELIRKYMLKWNFSYIFAATYYEHSIEKLKEEFGSRLLYLNRKRCRLDDDLSMNEKVWESAQQGKITELKKYSEKMWGESGIREKTIDYMKEVILLSRCQYFIGAKSSGTIAACIMNNGEYEGLYIIPDERGSRKY